MSERMYRAECRPVAPEGPCHAAPTHVVIAKLYAEPVAQSENCAVHVVDTVDALLALPVPVGEIIIRPLPAS